MREATRDRRAISASTRPRRPRSQPSLSTTTTADRAAPRIPHRSLNSDSASPSRVPPDMSSAAAVTLSRAESGSVTRSWLVSLVRRVAKQNTSTLREDCTAAWAKRSMVRAYGSIDPETSTNSTSFCGVFPRSRRTGATNSLPERIDALMVRRRSGSPRPESLRRLEGTAGVASRMPLTTECSSASSSGVHEARSRLASISTRLQATWSASMCSSEPSGSRSGSSTSGNVAGSGFTGISATGCRVVPGSVSPRNSAKAASKLARSSRRTSSVLRAAQ